MIDLITFNEKTVQALYDAILYDAITENGILQGMFYAGLDGNKIVIANGFGIIQGRVFRIEEEKVDVTLTPGTTTSGQVIIQIDLSNSESPISIFSDNTMRDLTRQEDFNVNAGIYEVQYCTYQVSGTGISNVERKFPIVRGGDYILPRIENLIQRMIEAERQLSQIKKYGVFWQKPNL